MKTTLIQTGSYGPISVPVEEFGPLGVTPFLECFGNGYALSNHWFTITHLATGHVIGTDKWTKTEATALARELSKVPGWDTISQNYRYDGTSRSAKEMREMVSAEFVDSVRRILAAHRFKRQCASSGKREEATQ